MPTNEEGEFELVLGNRQLLSVFFIGVVLLGVFFTMGYIVGRNTAPISSQIAEGEPVSRPTVVEQATARSGPPAPVDTSVRPSPVEPAKPKEIPRVEPPPPKSALARELKQQLPPEPKPARATSTGAAKGTFLQVAATKQTEAGLLADVLTKKGFPSTVAPVPDSPLFRVLVGPLRDNDVGPTREGLDKAGFKAIIRKF